MKEKDFYTAQELADKLQVNIMTIYRYIKAKRLNANKIGKNPEQELLMFDDLGKLDIYEKDEGKFYIKAISKSEEEKLVYNAKTGKSAPEEIVRQLYLKIGS